MFEKTYVAAVDVSAFALLEEGGEGEGCGEENGEGDGEGEFHVGGGFVGGNVALRGYLFHLIYDGGDGKVRVGVPVLIWLVYAPSF